MCIIWFQLYSKQSHQCTKIISSRELRQSPWRKTKSSHRSHHLDSRLKLSLKNQLSCQKKWENKLRLDCTELKICLIYYTLTVREAHWITIHDAVVKLWGLVVLSAEDVQELHVMFRPLAHLRRAPLGCERNCELLGELGRWPLAAFCQPLVQA